MAGGILERGDKPYGNPSIRYSQLKRGYFFRHFNIPSEDSRKIMEYIAEITQAQLRKAQERGITDLSISISDREVKFYSIVAEKG